MKGTLDLRVDWLSGDVSPQVRVVVTPGGGGLATNAADVRFLPGVHLQVVGEIVAPRKLLVTMLAFVVPCPSMLRHMSLPVALDSEL